MASIGGQVDDFDDASSSGTIGCILVSIIAFGTQVAQRKQESVAYNRPRPKMQNRAIFTRILILTLHNIGIGSNAKTKSAKMPQATEVSPTKLFEYSHYWRIKHSLALKYAQARRPSGEKHTALTVPVASQRKCIGRHCVKIVTVLVRFCQTTTSKIETYSVPQYCT